MNAEQRRCHEHQQVCEDIVGVLAGMLPDADRAELAIRLATLRLGPSRARSLCDYLSAHPDALSSGRPDGPSVRLALLRVLAVDHPQVRLACCVGCGQLKTLPYRLGDGRACQRCYAGQHLETCVRCGRVGRPTVREAGGVVCSRCYTADTDTWEPCCGCGKTRHVSYRIEGNPLCQSCGPRRTQPCGSCGRDRPVHAHTKRGPLCDRCYHLTRTAECTSCHRIVHIRFRDTTAGIAVCERCWSPPPATCVRCGQIKPCRRGMRAGRPIYQGCASRARPRRVCALCGSLQRIHSRLPLGDACGPCYTKIRRRPGRCAGCQAQRPLIGVDQHGARICGPCAGDTREWICRQCGRFAALFADGRCAHCVARQRLHDLLSGPDRHIRPQLRPLMDMLDVEGDPHQIVLLFHRAAWAELLGTLADEHEEITHELLDGLGRRPHVHYLRQVLVHAGVLPEREDYLETIPCWLEDLLATRPAPHAQLIRPYASWSVLRRARHRARRQAGMRSVGKHARARILVAVHFLSWLDTRGLTLATVTQHHVDAWLAAGTTTHYRLRDFLTWARARGLVGDITVPWLAREEPEHILPDDERWQLLRTCLTRQHVPLTLRVAGALVLLYGQTPSRIVELTTDRIIGKGGHTFLTLDRQPVVLPPRLADLVLGLAEHEPARRHPITERPDAPRTWLFPGGTPGRHADPGRLAKLLNEQLGIIVRPARNSALSAMAADLPAPVLAELLGVHITTAGRWAALVKRDWSGYVVARRHDEQVTKA
ncbi:MAG: hypothetical protein ACRDTH_24485 [Pseudonocardiaceae bacterium]